MLNKNVLLIITFMALWLTGCAFMHDGQGWDHEGDATTHEDSTPYLFDHKH